jgi:DNA helicase-2/ATP-dependent DNA helicase PcrA
MQPNEFLTKDLNPQQTRAVKKLQGPLLILAGAGSGKTRVLTHRAASLIAEGLASPEEFLAVTFTNKAAAEMEHRIYGILNDIGIPVHTPLWVSTFHSLSSRILRNHIELLDYKSFFSIYDTGDQLAQIKKILVQLDINDKIFPAKNFASKINTAKMLALGPTEVGKGSLNYDISTIQVYQKYEEEMKRANALDFGDLLLKVYELFRMYPDILSQYQQKFKYIMVDEYQDTNKIQYLLVQMLSKSHRNLCVVGDEDQSIYSWRGADISNILNFEKDFPEAEVVNLEENYRSTKNIVTAASSLIRNNTERKDKTLFTSNPDGDLITVREEKTEYDEARFVAQSIKSITNNADGNWQDIAIFYRTNAQSRVLEEQLRQNTIPYRIIGGVKFYDRMEIKDILCYMKFSLNFGDDIALKRIINTPARGIGKTTVERIEEFAGRHNISMWQALGKLIDGREFNSGTTIKLRRFIELIETLSRKQKESTKLSHFYHEILSDTDYLVKLKKDESPEAHSRIENLEEFDNAIAQFEKERGEEATLIKFLEEMALVSDADGMKEQSQSVTLMTLHISKGLEFPYVFMVGLEEGLFPSIRSTNELDPSDCEEERRLAYVGMTRARKKLYISYSQNRRVWGAEQYNNPSRFLDEIPKNLIQFQSGTPQMPSFLRKPYSNTFHKGRAKNNNEEAFDHQVDHQDFPDYDDNSSSKNSLTKGMRVKHPTFGVGSILDTEGSGEDLKVSIVFSDHTVKKFVAKYARLERI